MRDNLKVLVGALGGALLVLLLFAVFAGGGTGGMGPGGGMGPPAGAGPGMGSQMMQGVNSMMGGGMMGGGAAGGLFTLLFWGLVIALIAALVAWVVKGSQRQSISRRETDDGER